MDAEVSIHGQLALLFLGHGETKHLGGRAWESKVAHFIVARNQRVTGGSQGQDTVSKNMLPVTYFLQQGPTFHGSITSQ
jgi:hypothetical protein